MQAGRIQLTLRLATRMLSRRYTTAGKLVIVSKNESTGVSTITLNKPPVNGFNLELMTEFRDALETVQRDGSKGVILTSSLPTVFSYGLDIVEMYKPDVQQIRKLWTLFQDTCRIIYGLSLPIVAAINGSNSGSGYILSMCCEYRIFVDGKYQIGLPEVKLGIVMPTLGCEVCVAIVGQRKAELALLRGELFTPQQALQLGLVDELATDKEDALTKAEKYITDFANTSDEARAKTKDIMRRKVIEMFKHTQEHSIVDFFANISQPKVQAAIGMYIQSLQKNN